MSNTQERSDKERSDDITLADAVELLELVQLPYDCATDRDMLSEDIDALLAAYYEQPKARHCVPIEPLVWHDRLTLEEAVHTINTLIKAHNGRLA